MNVTTKTHTAFLVGYKADGKDVNTALNGGNIFPQLRGNLGTVIDTALRQHYPAVYGGIVGKITLPIASTSKTNRSGAPVAVHLTDPEIAIDVTDPDTGDKMLVAAKGLAYEGLPTLFEMIDIDTLEIANRLNLKLNKKQTQAIHEYLEGMNHLEAEGYIVRAVKPTLRKRSGLQLRSIKPSHKSKAVSKVVTKESNSGLSEAEKNAMFEKILGLL